MVKNNIVEINGKHYDADTGAVVKKAPAKASPKPVIKKHPSPNPVKEKEKEKVSFSKPIKKEETDTRRPTINVRSASSFSRRMTEELRRHPAERARTLMRAAVEKPKPSNRQLVHSHSGAQVSHTSLIVPKQSAASIDDSRLRHAEHISKSNLISHYNFNAPAHPVTRPEASETPLIAHQKATIAAAPRPQSTAEILNAAVERATTHEQPLFTPHGRNATRAKDRKLYGGAAAILIVILGGTLLHFSIPSITLQLASAKAGFAAAVPSTNPSGYAFGGIAASTGQVAVRYSDVSNGGTSYTIAEEPTTWNDSTLKTMFLRDCGPYQTIQSGNTAYYVYGSGNLTWVSSGIWYQLKSDGSLSDQQLVAIAASL